jgi:mRNA-degrading endonuclease RelE of RelBE toxin-antitoxin system
MKQTHNIHQEIYTKTISRLRLGDYKLIFTSPFRGSVNMGL